MNHRYRAFALVAAVLILVSPLAVVAINATALHPPTSQEISAPSAPLVSALENPATTMQATAQALVQASTPTTIGADLATLSPTYVASVWSALLNHESSKFSNLVPALNSNCGTNGGWCISTGIAAAALLICAISAGATLGLGCAAAGIAVLAVGLYELWFGESAASQVGQQVEALTEYIVTSAAQMFQLEALGVVNEVSALNATVNALGYEAAAAALSQLGNSSFSEPLDLAQSGVASQLGATLTAQMVSIGQLTGDFEATLSEQLGSGNLESDSCSAGLGSLWNPMASGNIPMPCPSSAPSSYSYTNGQLSTGIVYGPSADTVMWLNASTPITIQAGTSGQHISLEPIDGATPWYNLSISTSYQVVNFSGPAGAYQAVWSSGAAAEFWPAISFPLTSDDFPAHTEVEQYVLENAGAAVSVWPSLPLGIDGITCGPSTYTCGGNYGDTPTALSSVNAPSYLFQLALSAANMGEVYWLTLRDLGYTNANQVPSRCLILSPADLLPQDLTPTELASMNETSMLRMYYALMSNLAYTFNASSAITAFNVCGHHVTEPTGGGPIGFGTYAYGYIYVPNATGWKVPTSSHGSPPTFVTSQTASGTTAPSVTVSVAKNDTLVAEVFDLSGTPTHPSDGLSMSWSTLYTNSGGGGSGGLFVINATSASGSDTITATTTTKGALTVLVFSGSSGLAPLADLKDVGWVNPSGGTLAVLTGVTIPTNALAVPSLISYGAVNYTGPSGPAYVSGTCSSSTEAASTGAAEGCPSTYTAGSDKETFGYGSTSWVDFLTFAVLGSGITSSAPVAGPQVYANPETWNYSGLISFAPSIAGFSPSLGEAWLLPDDNPTFASVEPFTSNVTNPLSGYGYVNTIGPTVCASGGGGAAANCSTQKSPLMVLDYIGGNSSANAGTTGSVFPTHEDGTGAGYSMYLTECFTAQLGATPENVTYTPSTSGTCGFAHNTIDSTYFYECSDGALVFNISSCPTTAPILVVSPNGCGGVYLSWLAGPIASGLSAIPLIGGIACPLAEGIAILLLLVLVALIVWVVAKIVRAARGR